MVDQQEKERFEASIVGLFKDKINEDSRLKNRIGRLSNSIEVISIYSYNGKDCFRFNQMFNNKSYWNNNYIRVPKILGYRIKNIGHEVIQLATRKYKHNGELIAYKPIIKSLKPNDEIDITHRFMVMLTAQPEISFKIYNGIFKKNWRKAYSHLDTAALLDSYEFTTNEDIPVILVEEKKSCDNEIICVKQEYTETFSEIQDNNRVDFEEAALKCADINDNGKLTDCSNIEITEQSVHANFIYTLLKEYEYIKPSKKL